MFTEPIKRVYTGLTKKLGAPRESKNPAKLPPTAAVDTSISLEDILKNIDVEDHEIRYA